LLKSASRPAQGLVASLIGVVTLVLGATSIFADLQSDLDRIWRAPAANKPSGIVGLLRTRLWSFGLIVSIGFLLVSLVVSAGLAAFSKLYGGWFPGWVVTMEIVNQAVSLAFVSVLFAMMYRILPSVPVAWRDVWRGAFATAILFTIGKFLIGLYLGKAGVTSGFGAAGSIVVLLVWVFYSSQIFLLGAEFTWLYAHSHGSRAGEIAGPAPETPVNRTPADQRPAKDAAPRPARNPAWEVAAAALVWIGLGAIRTFTRRPRT
jgi:membrane protein